MEAIKLRDYQEDGVQGIRLAMRQGEAPVLFVLPTGGGKTYTFSYIASNAAARGNPVIIIVHRKELLLQASASLRNLGIEHGIISPHFTADPRKKVQVASIDTLAIRVRKNPQRYQFAMVIFDEAHHVIEGNKWGRIYEDLGRPAMLGVTATPVRSDGTGLGEGFGGVFKSMVLGPSVAELIRRGMLINPTVYTSLEMPDLAGVRKNKDGDWSTKALADRTDKPRITGSAVKHYTEVCPGARAIVFCINIQHARHVVEEFNAAGYRFALLVGQPEMSDAERTRVNRMLRDGELDGACTVDLVSEGYDLPDLQCCIMLRPTESEGLFLQQVGRVMRPSDGKDACYLLDHVGNVGRIIDGEFVRKHGLPDEEREWTLEGQKKGKGKKQEERKAPMLYCKGCFATFTPESAREAGEAYKNRNALWSGAPICPLCDTPIEFKVRKLEQVDGELVELTPEMRAAMSKAKKAEVKSAKTLSDLERIGAQRGYSPGWAKATYEAKQRIKAKYQKRRGPPPPPSDAHLRQMSLDQLEAVADAQGYPPTWASDFYHKHGAGSGLNDQQALGGL